ncbi:MAG: response regulator transcription factor [Prevotellaceae bacterium]|jgi:DNA-binding NarL/FixJ family response regulator|nr:response regulator transcription factor [Prevotellaceae bacterium]
MSYKVPIIMADNQPLTRAGLLSFVRQMSGDSLVQEAGSKAELIRLLAQQPSALVLLDYTLFDFTQAQELVNLCARFSTAHMLLISADLSSAFVKLISTGTANTSMVFKNSARAEITDALLAALRGERYLCSHVQELLHLPEVQDENNPLTKTEVEILKLIALGKSSKEIAAIRYLSQHTVASHRKNIFRKIEVNTVYEATRYAVRMGLVDIADYQI